MGFRSGVVIDLDFNFDADVETRTTSELIWMLKSSFRDVDFAKVESILVQREEKLKQELETAVQANDWLKEKLDDTGMKKHKDETEIWKKKYEELESRIRELDADIMLLASLDPSARVSSENGNNVVGQNVDLAGANVVRAAEESRRPPSGCIIPISDSDSDVDCCSEESLSRNDNKMTSQRVVNSNHSSQTGVQCVTGILKRKYHSFSNVNENETSTNSGVKVEDLDGDSLTADGKVAKIQKLSHGLDGSSINHCTEMASSSRARVEKFCPPSSQQAVISRQFEQKTGTELASQNLMRDFLLDVPGVCDIDCSSSSSSSSSGSESDVDLEFDFPQLTKIINDKKWVSESDMLAAFEKESELYLKAVCALYRKQTILGKLPRSLSSSNNRGFKQVNAHRATTLAEFLIDNDSQGKLKKSVPELLQFDQKGLDDCKKIVFDHSKQLFEIYQKKEDPLFMP